MNSAIAFEEHGNGMKCGFLNMGKKKVKVLGVYNLYVLRWWEECSSVLNIKQGLSRIDLVTKTVQEMEFVTTNSLSTAMHSVDSMDGPGLETIRFSLIDPSTRDEVLPSYLMILLRT